MDEKKANEIAKRSAQENVDETRRLIREGYSQQEIQTFLERKSFHLQNILSLAKEGKNWAAYPNMNVKSENKITPKRPFFEDQI